MPRLARLASVVFTSAGTVLGSMLAAAQPADAIVGGELAAAPSFAGSLQLRENGNPNWHACGVTLINPWWVQTQAHCVTPMPGTEMGVATAAAAAFRRASVHTDATIDPSDPSIYHIRLGSADRLRGGVLRHVTKIVVYPGWGWGVPDANNDIGDLALQRLDRPVFTLAPARIAPENPRQDVREIGWGYTVTDPSTMAGQPAERYLRQVTVPVQPMNACAPGGIGADELCLDGTGGGPCAGDSGSPALQPAAAWGAVIGSTSRGTGFTCGGAGQPDIYTNLSHYRDWIDQVTGGRTATASTAGHDPASAGS